MEKSAKLELEAGADSAEYTDREGGQNRTEEADHHVK